MFNMTAVELGKSIKSGEIGVKEALLAHLDKIAAENPKNNAFITVTREDALAAAEKIQKEISSGKLTSPLAGVPTGVKDNICTMGVKTSCASKILGDFLPPYDATVIERLKSHGCISLGKLNMDEFAMGSTGETSYYGAVKNPWNMDHVSGGSSGGAAAAVVSGEIAYALASDTGGSIRQPAAYCALTGIKPTYGTVSRYGLIAYASSLEQIGPIAFTAEDCAAVLDMIMGRDKRDSTSLDIPTGGLLNSLKADVKGMRVGIPEECLDEGLSADVKTKVMAAAKILEDAGAVVDTFSMPELKYAVPAYYILASAEASSNLSRFDGVKYGWRSEEYTDLKDMHIKTRTEGFGEEVKRRILLGTFVLSSGYYDEYYQKALRVKSVIRNTFLRAFEHFDILLTPTSPATAPKIGESLSDPIKMYLSDIYTVPANLAGLPALSMPCGFGDKGLPIGAQLIGPVLGEQKILNAAYTFQNITDFHKQRPKMNGGV